MAPCESAAHLQPPGPGGRCPALICGFGYDFPQLGISWASQSPGTQPQPYCALGSRQPLWSARRWGPARPRSGLEKAGEGQSSCVLALHGAYLSWSQAVVQRKTFKFEKLDLPWRSSSRALSNGRCWGRGVRGRFVLFLFVYVIFLLYPLLQVHCFFSCKNGF